MTAPSAGVSRQLGGGRLPQELGGQARIFTGVPRLTLVTPSRWLAGLVRRSFLKDYPLHVIPNGVDRTLFCPRPEEGTGPSPAFRHRGGGEAAAGRRQCLGTPQGTASFGGAGVPPSYRGASGGSRAAEGSGLWPSHLSGAVVPYCWGGGNGGLVQRGGCVYQPHAGGQFPQRGSGGPGLWDAGGGL